MPSTKLNDAVNLLADAEFADWDALDGEIGKDYAYRKLCRWHRGRCPYDADEEKTAFKGYDLNSLRSKALFEVQRGMSELRSGLPKELVALEWQLPTLSPSELELVISLIGELKLGAIQRGYFERFRKVLGFEKRVVMLLFEGAKLRSELRRVKAETVQAKANLVLAAEIAHYHAEYLMKVKDEWLTTGVRNEILITEYESSPFASKDVSGYPEKLVCNKWIIDAFFLDMRTNRAGACKLAEKVYLLNREVSVLSPKEHCLLLSRLANYYANLGEGVKAKTVITYFETIGPETTDFHRIYLKRYLYTMFLVAVDTDDAAIEKKAMEVFERNESRIVESEKDNDWLVILIFVMTHFLGSHQGNKAKRIFDLIYRVKDQKPPLQFRVQYMICHLMILFELGVQADIQQFSKNYKDFLKPHLPFTAPALAVLAFLRGNIKNQVAVRPTNKKEAKIEAKKVTQFNSKIDDLLAKLKTYQEDQDTYRSIWYGPFYKWVNSKRLVTVDDENITDSIPHSKSQ